MKPRKIDSKEQIIKAFADEEPCQVCGLRQRLSEHRRLNGDIVKVCFWCHREELRIIKKLRCKEVKNGT